MLIIYIIISIEGYVAQLNRDAKDLYYMVPPQISSVLGQ